VIDMDKITRGAARSSVDKAFVVPSDLIEAVYDLVSDKAGKYTVAVATRERVWGSVNPQRLYSAIRSSLKIGDEHW